MLMQTLNVGQTIWIGDVPLKILGVTGRRGNQSCRVGIEAPQDVDVIRGEAEFGDAYEGDDPPCRD